MKSTKLLLIATMLVGFSACAPRYTCPAYAKKDINKEVPVRNIEQESM